MEHESGLLKLIADSAENGDFATQRKAASMLPVAPKKGKFWDPNDATGQRAGMMVADNAPIYRQATHNKKPGLIQRATRLLKGILHQIDPEKTSAQGSGVASPTLYGPSLISLRYERWQVIADCNQMYLEEPRAHKSVDKFVWEAVRKGVLIPVNVQASGKNGEKAQMLFNEVRNMILMQLSTWGHAMMIEGEWFLEAVLQGDDLVQVNIHPAAAMERNTDDAGHFIDPVDAYTQLDTLTQATIASFPESLIHHGRWNLQVGNKYGTPPMIALRRAWRQILLMEESKRLQIMTRAVAQKVHKFPEGTTDEDKNAYKAQVGYVEGNQDPYNPLNAVADLFIEGDMEVQVLNSDRNTSQVDHLTYFQSWYTASLPTPGVLFMVSPEGVNRDVLEDARKEWLKEVQRLQDHLIDAIRWLCTIKLLLHDIVPEEIVYSVHLSDSTVETPSEVNTRTVQAYNANLIPQRIAMANLAEFYGIENVISAMEEIRQDQAQRAKDAQDGSHLPLGASGFNPMVWEESKASARAGTPPDKPEQGTPAKKGFGPNVTAPTNGNGNGKALTPKTAVPASASEETSHN